jgi:prophage regulatory protein
MHPQPRLLRLPDVLDKVGLRRTHFYDLVKRGAFPPPVKLSERAVAWPEDRVDQWIAERIARAQRAVA